MLINFSDAEQNERVKLPTSELAKPPDAPIDDPIFLHLTKQGSVFFGGEEIASVSGVESYLVREANIMSRKGASRLGSNRHHPSGRRSQSRTRSTAHPSVPERTV